MLSYIMSVDQIKSKGGNPNKSRVVFASRGKRPEIWRKVFMNGDDVGFFVLSRK